MSKAADGERLVPLSFVALDTAILSAEERFLRSPMKPVQDLVPAARASAAAAQQYRDFVRVLYDAVLAFMRAESPGWQYGPTKVMSRFGTDHKKFDALFRGTAWGSSELIFSLAVQLNMSFVAVTDPGAAAEAAGRAAMRLRQLTQALDERAAAVADAVGALDAIAAELSATDELREATENARTSAARLLAEAQEQVKAQHRQ